MPENEDGGRPNLDLNDTGEDLSLEEQIDRINWILLWKAKMEEWRRKYGDKNPNVTASTGGPEYGTRNYTPDPNAAGEIPWTPMPEGEIPWTPMPEGDMSWWDKVVPDWASDLWGDTPNWLKDILKNLGKNFVGGKAGELFGPDIGPAEQQRAEMMQILMDVMQDSRGAVDNLENFYEGATFHGPNPEDLANIFGFGEIVADEAGTRFSRGIPYGDASQSLANLVSDRDWQWEGQRDILRELANARSGVAGTVGGLATGGANLSTQWLQQLLGIQGDIAKQFTGGSEMDTLARQFAEAIAKLGLRSSQGGN